jgi:hypothetical protein
MSDASEASSPKTSLVLCVCRSEHIFVMPFSSPSLTFSYSHLLRILVSRATLGGA